MGAPILGHGSSLEILGPAGGTQLTTPLPVACLSIDPGSNKIDTPDTTDMLSTGTQRTFTPGLENSGDVSFKFNYKPGDAGQAGLFVAKGVLTNYKIVAPSPSTWTRAFSGILQGVDFSFPDDKPITGSGKIQISGAVTDTTM